MRFSEFYEATYPDTFHGMYSIFRNREDAEDATQRAYFRMSMKFNGFRGDSAFSSWFYRLAHNVAMSMLREKSLEKRFVADVYAPDSQDRDELSVDTNEFGVCADFEDRLIYEEQKRLVEGEMAYIKPECKQILLMRLDDMKFTEIAETACLNIQTAKSRARRGREELARRVHERISAAGNGYHKPEAVDGEIGRDAEDKVAVALKMDATCSLQDYRMLPYRERDAFIPFPRETSLRLAKPQTVEAKACNKLKSKRAGKNNKLSSQPMVYEIPEHEKHENPRRDFDIDAAYSKFGRSRCGVFHDGRLYLSSRYLKDYDREPMEQSGVLRKLGGVDEVKQMGIPVLAFGNSRSVFYEVDPEKFKSYLAGLLEIRARAQDVLRILNSW